MIINKGGCGRTSPGIGDIKFVKDLMTDNIVTTKFRCSKFGMAHNAKTQFGWVCIYSLLFRNFPGSTWNHCGITKTYKKCIYHASSRVLYIFAIELK
jgi:hypothetical protein